jgi:iron complex transport system permease protein
VNPLVLPFGLLLLCVTALVALGIGAVPIRVPEVWSALFGDGESQVVAIIRDLRGPRVVLSALVGAGLATSGAALQGTLRNPLAEPYLLGVSGGAAVGAVVALTLGFGSPLLVTLAAFGGAAVATAVVALLARIAGGRPEPRMLLMAGVVVGAFSNAVILVALADAPPDRIRGALWWMMGSTADATWAAVGRTALALLIFGGLLVVRARELDLLALGEEPAVALGAEVDASTRRVFLVASWLAASTVAAVGLIGFVGLVVPNLARALGAHRHRAMLLVSAVYGAALLVGADIAARSVRAPIELPLGAVTALVGVPFFLARLRQLA